MLRRPALALAPAAWLLLAGLLRGNEVGASRVNKHKPWLEPTYHGIVTENDNTVLLDPPLIALDKDAPLRFAESFEVTVTAEGEICGFKIHGQNVPFEAVVVDKSTGEGLLRSKEKLDCELQKDYTFTIQAYDCGRGPGGGAGMKKSHKATVHVQVNDVNEHAPVFKEKSYQATAVEGWRRESVLRVEAVDADCSPQFSQICSYEILTPDVPFSVDKDGYIRNTEKLKYGKEHQYKLMVTAYDCGKKRAAEDVLVKISVQPSCTPGWQGWSERVEYEPGTGALALFPGLRLETCAQPVVSVQATVELETSHIGKGCDRDTYSEKSLHRLCGAAAGTAELLPSPSGSLNWTVGLPADGLSAGPCRRRGVACVASAGGSGGSGGVGGCKTAWVREMAADISEAGGQDCRGDPRGNPKSDADYPLRVLYCGVCSLPTEYCEYMPDVAKCRQWLEKNFPNEFAKLTVENSPKQEAGITEGQGTAGEEEEKKKQKRGGRGQIKQKKKTVPQKVTIAKIPRAKKKYVTRVCGLATFEIDLKEAQRFFAQKFSCGASVTGEDEIIIQGDFTDDIIDVIQEKWPEVDDDSIEDLGEVKK